MADELRISDKTALDRPVLIAAFRGWNDGGQGASLAAGYLARLWDAEQIADVDPEGFSTFRRRGRIKLVDGLTRRSTGQRRSSTALASTAWNAMSCCSWAWAEPPLARSPEMVTGFAEELGVELVITLGSLLADIPHTRPSPVTGSASTTKMIERLGLQASRYEAPLDHQHPRRYRRRDCRRRASGPRCRTTSR